LGTSPPYVFTAFLKQAFPKAEFTVIQEIPAGLRWRDKITARHAQTSDIEVEAFALNVEMTPLPFQNDEFDLVVAMEILEHFAIDPSFVFRESQRVLREGGALLVTTPNLISLPGIHRALSGESPYSFGVFVPWHGTYGRHNREYTPSEVESLASYAGFDTAFLETSDVYRQEDVPDALPRYMREHDYPLNLRGQNTFYLGLKNSSAAPKPFPANLFPIDPAMLSGKVGLERSSADKNGYIIKIMNPSLRTWLAEGPQRMRLTVDRVDQNGLVSLDAQSFDLSEDLAPGAVLSIPVRALRDPEGQEYWHEIGLYLNGAGPLKGAGRTKTVSIFARELQLAPELQHDNDAT
jgi:SAM-dependent methyltransferase